MAQLSNAIGYGSDEAVAKFKHLRESIDAFLMFDAGFCDDFTRIYEGRTGRRLTGTELQIVMGDFIACREALNKKRERISRNGI